MSSVTIFPKTWVDGSKFEEALGDDPEPHDADDIWFLVPNACKIMTDAAVRLLSLCNQLAFSGRQVHVGFESTDSSPMSYLNRIGFFDHLSKRVDVHPHRPRYSGAPWYGTNPGVVEIAPINLGDPAKAKKTTLLLTKALKDACSQRPDVDSLADAGWTIFAELIGNIFEHSDTPIDGYAALQVYKGGHSLKVAVSDSGHGILETLRPVLESKHPGLVGLSDGNLLVEIFRQGISRHGEDRGHGLQGSAAKAMRFGAALEVRLPEARATLKPERGFYRLITANPPPKIGGTHICFSFDLTAAG